MSIRPMAITTVVAATALLAGCAGSGTSEPRPTGGVEAFGSVIAEPTVGGSTSPSASADASSSPSASASGWTLAATFEEAGTRAEALTLLRWQDGFVAIGHRAATDNPALPGEPRLWRSDDGRAWNEGRPDLGHEDARIQGGSVLEDGRLMLVGFTGDAYASEPLEPRAWVSDDLASWTEVQLPFGDSPTAASYAAGPVGHVVAHARTIWFSANGIDWEPVFEVPDGNLQSPRAGDEGFVLMRTRESGGPPTLLASGDGRAWFETEPRAINDVAPFGGDWLGFEYSEDGTTVMLSRSANGLDWEAYQDVNELTPPDGPKAGRGMASEIQRVTFTSAAGTVVMTFSWNHCCAQLAQGVMVLSSTDATDWTEIDLGENAVVHGSAANDEVIVLGGYLNRGQAAAFWVLDR